MLVIGLVGLSLTIYWSWIIIGRTIDLSCLFWLNLNDGYAEEVEISDTAELFKQILWQEVQRRVLGGNNFIIGKILTVIFGRRVGILRNGITNEDKPIRSRVPPCTSSLLTDI